MALNEEAVRALRSEFPSLGVRIDGRPIMFFCGPGGSQTHGSVIRAMEGYLTEANSNIHGSFLFSRRTDDTVLAVAWPWLTS